MYTAFKIMVGIIIALVIIYFALPSTFDAKEYAKGNHCPYEGYECPNAQQAMADDEAELQSMSSYADSMKIQYDNAEHVIDSLVDRNKQLETQLAGCELQNHSKLSKNSIVKLTRDSRGLISVLGNNYALDYITEAEFYKTFGFKSIDF